MGGKSQKNVRDHRPTPSRKQQLLERHEEIAKNSGLIRMTFTFDGKEHVAIHRLTQSEMEEQQRLLREHGVKAFEAVLLQVSIWGAARLGEHVVTEAFKEYARKHYRDPAAQEQIERIEHNGKEGTEK